MKDLVVTQFWTVLLTAVSTLVVTLLIQKAQNRRDARAIRNQVIALARAAAATATAASDGTHFAAAILAPITVLQTRLGDKDVALAFDKDDLTALFSTLSLFPQYVEQVLSFEKAHEADPNDVKALAIRRGTVQFLSANLGKSLERVLSQLGEDAKMRAWTTAGPDTAELAEFYRNKNKIEDPL